MDRATVYTQEQGRSVDFLFAQRATMIGLAKLSQAAFGSGTVVRGLAVTPNSPAALNVLVGIGEIYAMTQVDATTWGALPADTTDIILKQGLNMAAQTISTPAPTTSGYSINYLIEAQYQDQDNVLVVLPFYNSNNPQIPLNGQGGGGASLPTERQGVCVIQAKAGIAAPTGTQTTPSVDSGWTALAVVTVANGQSTVVSGNISVPAGVPQLTNLLQMIQTGSTAYAVDTSTTANVISVALTPAITAYTDGQEITFKAANSNTGPCTINFGGGTVNLVGAAGAFQGGEIVAGNQYTGIYSGSLNEVVLNSQTAGALQVNPGTKSQHAVQLGQLTQAGVVPGRLLKVTTFSATGTWTPQAATSTIRVRLVGGGGSGGGVALTGSGQVAIAAGAGSGSYHEFVIANPGAQTVTIGAAGASSGAGSGTGGNGGSTTFGAIAAAPGGTGGGGGTAFTITQASTSSATPGSGGGIPAAIAGTVVAAGGAAGSYGVGYGVGNVIGGGGGSAAFGGGGKQGNNAPGSPGTAAGGGGGGASQVQNSASGVAGGLGLAGVAIVEEFA